MVQNRRRSPGDRGRSRLSLGVVVAASALLVSCSGGEGGHRSGQVVVFAAASLQGAFTEVGHAFEQRHPGTTVHFNFAGSQQLATQIQLGARADVFASADERWMTRVEEGGQTAGRPVPFAENRLVIIVPRSNPAGIDSVADLARPGVRVVMGTAEVPAGAYARKALESLSGAPGFSEDFGDSVLANAVSLEENVKLVLAKIQLGEADAGFVYASDVAAPAQEQVRVLSIPPPGDVRATYPIVLLRGAAAPGPARDFVRFILSSEGESVLARHGFLPVR